MTESLRPVPAFGTAREAAQHGLNAFYLEDVPRDQLGRELAEHLLAALDENERLRSALGGSDDYLRLMFRHHIDTDPILGAVLDCNANALEGGNG